MSKTNKAASFRLKRRGRSQCIIKDEQGATAIEFAILALPFFTLLFAIIELAYIFFLGSSLTHGTSEAARRVRTGEFQATCGNATAFKQAVCKNMGGGASCMKNLRIDVVSSPTGRFEPDLLPPTPLTTDPNAPGTPQKLPDKYMNTGARDVVVVRAQYYHKLAFPGELTRLSNQPGNTRLVTATTAFRNEPFPSGCGS